MREIDRVFAGEENPHHEWAMKCPENPHSLSIPIVSHDYWEDYRFTDITNNITSQFSTKKLINIRSLSLIARVSIRMFDLFGASWNKCPTTCPLHRRADNSIGNRRRGDFALQPLE